MESKKVVLEEKNTMVNILQNVSQSLLLEQTQYIVQSATQAYVPPRVIDRFLNLNQKIQPGEKVDASGNKDEQLNTICTNFSSLILFMAEASP